MGSMKVVPSISRSSDVEVTKDCVGGCDGHSLVLYTFLKYLQCLSVWFLSLTNFDPKAKLISILLWVAQKSDDISWRAIN
jgi:hypothetical protein